MNSKSDRTFSKPTPLKSHGYPSVAISKYRNYSFGSKKFSKWMTKSGAGGGKGFSRYRSLSSKQKGVSGDANDTVNMQVEEEPEPEVIKGITLIVLIESNVSHIYSSI
jgi:hypothetical protein